MCLADFAVEYDVCYKATGKRNDDHEDDVQPAEQSPTGDQYDSIITLHDSMGKMHHRKTRAILMSHKFSADTEPEKYYHSELMLYTAWRDEEQDLLGNFDTYSESYTSQQDEITAVTQSMNSLTRAAAQCVG